MSKNALVTGAGTGIGRAIARVLAKAGYDVGLHCNASRDGAESAAAEIRTLGRHAEVFQADLSDLNAIGGMFEAFQREFSRLDLFVNNAGITLLAPFLEMTPEAFDRNYAVDFRAPYFCMQRAAKMMVEQGSGNIVAIASNNAYCQFAPRERDRPRLDGHGRGPARREGVHLLQDSAPPLGSARGDRRDSPLLRLPCGGLHHRRDACDGRRRAASFRQG